MVSISTSSASCSSERPSSNLSCSIFTSLLSTSSPLRIRLLSMKYCVGCSKLKLATLIYRKKNLIPFSITFECTKCIIIMLKFLTYPMCDLKVFLTSQLIMSLLRILFHLVDKFHRQPMTN